MKVTYRSCIAITCYILIVFFFLAHVSSALPETRGELTPKGQNLSMAVFQETATWPATQSGGSSVTLTLIKDPGATEMAILSNASVSVYILNQTEMIKGLNSSWNMAKFKPQVSSELRAWINTTQVIETNLTYQHFQNDWGIENFTTMSPAHATVYNLVFYILIVNENSNYAAYSFKWETPNPALSDLGTVLGFLMYTVLFAVGFVLLVKARIEQKKSSGKVLAHVYRNFAYGMIAGGIATFAWQLWGWIWGSFPSASWNSALTFIWMPSWVLGGILSQNILTFLTLVCFGASVAFISNSIEKDIQQRKIPYLTYLMLATELLIIAFAFVVVYVPGLEIAFGIIIYIWFGSMLLIAANIIITYVRVILQSTGQLRKKTSIVLISVVIIFVSLIARTLINPNFIPNAIGAFSTLCFYKGITMD